MRLSVSAGFYLKDRPKDYRGATQEQWTFGKKKPATLAELATSILGVLFLWHLRWLSVEEANQEKQKIQEWLDSRAFFVEEGPAVAQRTGRQGTTKLPLDKLGEI